MTLLEHHEVQVPAGWAAARTITLTAAIEALRMLANPALTHGEIRARPQPIPWRRTEAGVMTLAGGRDVLLDRRELAEFAEEVDLRIMGAIAASSVGPLYQNLLLAAATLRPELALLTGVDRTPVPFRARRGPGFLDEFYTHTRFGFPVDVDPEWSAPHSVSSCHHPDFTEEVAMHRDARWLLAARALPPPQYTYWWSRDYLNGLVCSTHGAVSWFRDHRDVASTAHASRLAGRIEAFHQLAVVTELGFGLDAGVLVADR
jgi:hypothetical protein